MVPLLIAALGAYATGTLVARAAFRRVLFPRPVGSACPDDACLWTLRAADGAKVHAIEVAPPEGGAATTMLYFHGNGQTAAEVVPLARVIADRGIRVVIGEYRGYGLSRGSGSPTEAGLYADAEAVALEARRRYGAVSLWGTSLGSAVAIEMAARRTPEAIVLVSPFTSMLALCRRHAPVLVARAVVRDRFDSLSKTGQVRAPTLVLHGENDRLVPAAMGRELAARIAGARFCGLPRAGHDVFFTHGDDIVREALAHLTSATGGTTGRAATDR